MGLQTFCKRVMLASVLVGATAMAGAPSKRILESVKAMEREYGLTIKWHFDLERSLRRTLRVPPNYNLYLSSMSPDGNTFAWSSYPTPYQGEKLPFITIQSLTDGIQPIELSRRVVAVGSSVSVGAEVIVVLAIPVDAARRDRWELLAIDRRQGVVVHDLTTFVTRFKLGNNIGDIRVSGPGNLVAIGTNDTGQIQVLEILSGKTLFAGDGTCPRLSPDGKRLARVNEGSIWIHSFVDNTTTQLLKGKRVKGIGGWSPDGRYLLAGAWTTLLAIDKRQIVVDTTTGKYAVIGKLSEGDYGCQYEWVSQRLLEKITSNPVRAQEFPTN